MQEIKQINLPVKEPTWLKICNNLSIVYPPLYTSSPKYKTEKKDGNKKED